MAKHFPLTKAGRRRHEGGTVLIITLVMLMVLTMLVLAAMSANTSEERMAGNSRDWTTAFQAAEAALRDAEKDIAAGTRISGVTNFASGCSDTGLCLLSQTGTPNWIALNAADQGWIGSAGSSTSKSVRYGTFTSAAALDKVASQPRYIIEAMPVQQESQKQGKSGAPVIDYFYRVTAVGFGQNISSRVMLQAVYRK